jgi:RND family efflux transporter MFP subunit
MLRKRVFWIALIIVLMLAGSGGYAYYRLVYLPRQAATEPTIATTQVRRGDLVISVSGSGTLIPAAESDLGFQTAGYVDEVLVQVGDHVKAGDVLARLETGDLKVAVDEADINSRLAQFDLADASTGPTDAELASARASLESAQTALIVAQYAYSNTLNSSLDSAVRARQIEFQWYVDRYQEMEANGASQSDLQSAWDDRAAAEYRFNGALQQAQMEDLSARNQLDQAQNAVYQTQAKLELVQSGPTITSTLQAQQRADQAELALEDARANLVAAELRAPFDGTVVDVTAIAGQYVGASPIITLDDLAQPLLQFWVDESDMSGVTVGEKVEITFVALPDDTFTGRVTRIDPALVTVGNTLAVQAWASVDLSSARSTRLLGGMNADVEVISAEARDALLVPVEALRQLGTGQYAVMVVQPDGTMALRPVEVGLKDLVNAEILSGLAEGEVVSLGEQQTTETTVPEQQMPGEGPVFGPPGGGGGGFIVGPP